MEHHWLAITDFMRVFTTQAGQFPLKTKCMLQHSLYEMCQPTGNSATAVDKQ